MRVIHDNFRSLPINARQFELTVQNDEELNKLLSCVAIAQSSMLSNTN